MNPSRLRFMREPPLEGLRESLCTSIIAERPDRRKFESPRGEPAAF